MSRLFLPRHHRTHEPGGSDEIRSNLVDPGTLTAIPLEFAGELGVQNGRALGGFDSGTAYDWTIDTAFTHNGALKSTTNGAQFFFPFSFTPAGSLWSFSARGAEGSDFGILQIALASIGSPNPNRGGVDDRGTLNDQEADMTFVNVPAAVVDCYNATPLTEHLYMLNAAFRVHGIAGSPLTAFSGTDGYTGFTLMDGGPGWYMVKVFTNGKHASSSGYRINLSSLVIARVAG